MKNRPGIIPKKYYFRGELRLVTEVAAMSGCNRTDVYKRIEGDRIRERVHRQPHYITFAGKTLRLSDWSKQTGIPHPTILNRLKRGWPVDRALTVPSRDQEL